MKLKQMLLDNLKDHWAGCTACPISEHAKQKVFGRGSLNAQVVFVGEGPGKLEDIEGVPFVGQAGRLLEAAIAETKIDARLFFTNLIACRPCDKLGGPNRAPSEIEIQNCSDRLSKTLFCVAPRVVVLLGKVPREAVAKADFLQGYRVFCLEHPAFILRCGGKKAPNYPNYVKKLKEALRVSQN